MLKAIWNLYKEAVIMSHPNELGNDKFYIKK